MQAVILKTRGTLLEFPTLDSRPRENDEKTFDIFADVPINALVNGLTLWQFSLRAIIPRKNCPVRK